MWESWQWNIERIRDMGVYQSNRPLLFNSLDFFVFFILLYAGYMFLYRRSNLRILYLLAFSLFFYYKTSGWFLLLLLLVSLLNYVSAHLVFVSRGRSARLAFMWCGVLSSLGFLGYYKYSRWFLETLQVLGVKGWSLPDIALPVGISFFTFQALSYTIDVYRGTLQPTGAGARNAGQWLRGFGDFAFYISFFPQLVAGPIVRAADFIPQIRQMPVLDKERLGRGLFLIMGGLFKKAVLSDYISI
ncbi:MAG: MBOAT family protein, partial [Haliscomenobacter sp.]